MPYRSDMVAPVSLTAMRVVGRFLRGALAIALFAALYHAVQMTNPEFTVTANQLQQAAPPPNRQPAIAGTAGIRADDDEQSSRWQRQYRQTLMGERNQGRSGLWRMLAIVAVLAASDLVLRQRLQLAQRLDASTRPEEAAAKNFR